MSRADGAPARPDDGLPADTQHYALAEDDPTALDSWRARLDTAGVAFWEEDHGDQRSLYFPDPNGVIFEVTSPPSAPSGTPAPAARAAAESWIAAHA